MKKTYTRNIGKNRGAPRLWLEGSILADAGFANGQTFDAYVEDGALILRACIVQSPPFTRKVAGTPDRPIIDINNAKLLGEAGFATGDVVELTPRTILRASALSVRKVTA